MNAIKQWIKPEFTWAHPCKECPSFWYLPDPEMLDNETHGRYYVESLAFACAWRQEGYCAGYAMRMQEQFGTRN